ncbi:MAG: HAMP domain-containing histidine kinase [Actinomycetota bacterium]|nr:HAMP domain-containing histidine kinase [Actinomycetota bacterium]
MTLRTKALLALVVLAAAATVAIGSLAYLATGQQLSAEIDNSLRDVAAYAVTQGSAQAGHVPGGQGGGGQRGGGDNAQPPLQFETVLVQEVRADGSVLDGPTGITVPVSASDRAIASGTQPDAQYRNLVISGKSYRMLTTANDHGGAVQVLRPLAERDGVLSSLRWKILLAAIIVIAAAAGTGWLLARQITRRLTRLAGAAALVAATGRLDVKIPDAGTDEVSQVATAFRRMLDALHRSEIAQRRLVQDAGHELRTPLTSLRTNLDVLSRHPDLPAHQHATVIADLQSETGELSSLVNELVELTSGETPAPAPEYVRLGDLARRVVDRAVRRSGRQIQMHADESTTLGQRPALERAIGNLIDNAIKFSPPDHPIEVSVTEGRIEVRDHGSGLSPTDLPRIFDRFYRATEARQLPGSGLGLAIVSNVAAAHGGSVLAHNHPGGGAVVGFRVPTSEASTGATAGFTPSSNLP